MILEYLVSFIPILVPFVLLVIFRMSAKSGMSISMLLIIIGGYFLWGITFDVITGSVFIGLHKTITILLILFGALTLVNTLNNTKAIKRINEGFMSITQDKRLLSVIVVFLFGGLIEGASGFGTPATITGPLLVSIGFNPFVGAVLALIGDSTAVSFGAVGTPLIVGLQGTGASFSAVANAITMIDLFSGLFVPLMISVMYIIVSNQKNKLRSIKEVVPWTLYVGFLYVVFAFISSRLIGFEFVSIITPIITIMIVSYTTMKGFLVPHYEPVVKEDNKSSLVKAWSPYIVVVILLILSRIVTPIEEFLVNLDFLSIKNVLGTGLSSSFSIFYSPGFILIIAAVFASFYQTGKLDAVLKAMKDTKGVLIGATLALVPTLIMVTIFTSSGMNVNDLVSMPQYIASGMSNVFGEFWSFGSTYLGMIGSFISGSATVSNLTFAPIQVEIASTVGLSVTVILASQVLGAAIGNMICVHNVVAASYVVGLENQEGSIIKKTILTALIYSTIVTIITTIIVLLF